MNVLQYWYTGPWRWDDSDASMPHWAPPAGCSGLDLRSLPEQSQQGGTPGLGLFWGPVKPAAVGSDYTFLGSGSWHDIKSTGKMRDAIRLPGRRRWRGDAPDLVGLVFQIMTDGSDPAGDDGPKPLMPNRHGQLSLACGQKYRQRFRWGRHPHTNRVQALLQGDFDRQMDDAAAGRMKDREHHRRILDASREKFARMGLADWRDLVPANRRRDVPGPLQHETTITDDFNRSDESLDAGPWTEVTGNLSVISNRLGLAAATSNSDARHTSSLSSADHYAQVDFVTSSGITTFVAGAARFAGSARTYYAGLAPTDASAGTMGIWKVVSGSFTRLTSPTHESGVGKVNRTEADGSSISQSLDASEVSSLTDTAITGNVQTGVLMRAAATSERGDNFEASDLAAGGGIVYTQLERDVRGMNRGIWTGGIG